MKSNYQVDVETGIRNYCGTLSTTTKDRQKERAGFCCIADTKDLANNALNVSGVNLKNVFMRN